MPVRLRRSTLLMLMAIASGLHAQAVSGPARGERLGYAERPGMGSLNPYESRVMTAPTDRSLSMIYEPLYRYNFLRTDGWEDVIAGGEPTRVPATKGGASAWSVPLKSTVKWHDGTPLTAADVIFTYNYIRATAANRGLREEYTEALVDVRTGAPGTVVFEFKATVREPKLFLWQYIIPASRFNHPPAFVPAASIGSVTITPVSEEKDIDRSPLGTGPFRFERRINTDQPPILARFDAYHGGSSNLDGVNGRTFLDQSTMIQTFLAAGQGINLVVEVPPRFLPQVEDNERVQTREVSSYHVLAVALRQKPNSILNNERVRRALTMAIDRNQILKNWFGGYGEVLASPVMSQAPYYDAKVQPLAFDLAAARRELQGARVPQGTTLKLIYKNVDQGSDTRIGDMITSIRDALESIGLKITVQKRDPDYFNGDVQKGDYDMALLEWEFNPAYNLRQIFHSEARDNDGQNYMQYSDQQTDTWLEEYDNATDRDQALTLMSLVQRRLNEKAPAIFLVSLKRVYAYDVKYTLTDIDPFNFFTYAHKWWFNRR